MALNSATHRMSIRCGDYGSKITYHKVQCERNLCIIITCALAAIYRTSIRSVLFLFVYPHVRNSAQTAMEACVCDSHRQQERKKTTLWSLFLALLSMSESSGRFCMYAIPYVSMLSKPNVQSKKKTSTIIKQFPQSSMPCRNGQRQKHINRRLKDLSQTHIFRGRNIRARKNRNTVVDVTIDTNWTT